MVAQRRNQFGLALSGVSTDAELLGSLFQFGHCPIVVRARFTALASDVGRAPCSGRVGDAGGLLFGITLLPQFRVDLLVLNRPSHTGSLLITATWCVDLWFPAPTPFKRSASTSVFPSRLGREH